MNQIKQWVNNKFLKGLLGAIITLALVIIVVQLNEITAFAKTDNEIYIVTGHDLEGNEIIKPIIDVATISESENIINITLTEDVNGMIIIEGIYDTTIVLDANGKTINGSNQNEALQVHNLNQATVILKGNGIYNQGRNHTVYVGRGRLIIESGTFNASSFGVTVINSYVDFRLAEGFDYYTVTTNGVDLFDSKNTEEKNTKDKDCYYIPTEEGPLRVFQHKEKYQVTVNSGMTAETSYEAGETITITANEAETGKKFKEWSIVTGDVSLLSNTSGETTFIMPAETVEIMAIYEDIIVPQPTPTPVPSPSETASQSPSTAPTESGTAEVDLIKSEPNEILPVKTEPSETFPIKPESFNTEKATSDSKEDVPKTGDKAPIIGFVVLFLVSGAVVVYLGKSIKFTQDSSKQNNNHF